MNKMKIIGLTGGIGSGKSTVAAILSELGAQVIDADSIGHQLLEQNQIVKCRIIKRFGTDILNADGTISRKSLANKVFGSRYETKFLNRLLHPLIRNYIEKQIKSIAKTKNKTLVIEAALLIEAGWEDLADTIWVTEAPLEIRLTRLEGRGLPRQEALERIKGQISDEDRRTFADALIDTNVNLHALNIEVAQLLACYLAQ